MRVHRLSALRHRFRHSQCHQSSWSSTDGACVYDSGDYADGGGGMTIRIRGNSSAYHGKKPFKVKLGTKADLLRRGNDAVFGDRDWLLMKEEYNPQGGTLLYTMIGLETARLCGMRWEPRARFVNLTVNGDYRGVYMLCESVKRNPDCRIDVDKDTGYIVEYDPYWWNEDVWFSTSRHQKKYTFKYPDPDDVTAEDVEYIKEAFDRLEESLWSGGYPWLVDVWSMATWLLAHDLLGTHDAYGSNIFITKYDNTSGSRLTMGPLWDFDSIMWTEGTWAPVHNTFDFYFYYLLCLAGSRGVPLAEAYRSCWDTVAKDVPHKMEEYLLSFAAGSEAAALQASNEWDAARWRHASPSVDEMVGDGVVWFRERAVWMASNLSTIGMRHQHAAPSPSTSATYDLQGRRVSGTPRPGIYIRGGRKVVNSRRVDK